MLRIPTHLWIEAKIRELSAQGIGVYVIHKGEKMDGVVMVKMLLGQGESHLQTQQRDLDGVLQWIDVFKEGRVTETKADDYITRATARDPDLWVLEVEMTDNPFRNL